MKYKQEGLKIVTYREPEPRHINWETVAVTLTGLAVLAAIGNLCVVYGF